MTIHQKPESVAAATELSTAPCKRCRTKSDRKGDKLEFRLVLALSFLVCVVPLAIRRMVEAGKARDRAARESVLAEAKSAAYAVAGYAFHA